MHEKIKYSIVKKTLVNVIFGCSDEYKESMGPKFECPVYEYKNRRKLTFFPITTDDAGDFLFTCVDCYHVYCVVSQYSLIFFNNLFFLDDRFTESTGKRAGFQIGKIG